LKEEVIYKETKSVNIALGPGVHVKMRTGDTYGIIESLDRKTATVIMGDLRMQVALRDLIPIEAPIQSGKKGGVVFDTVQANAAFESKIDIRGFRKDEAIRRVQEFMDKAALSSVNQLEILHGKGDGILKRIVKEKLREYSFVRKIRHPAPDQGGDGITIVDIEV
jgi:DNA mismatch repair protein MutS2